MWCLVWGKGGREYFDGDFLFIFGFCLGFFCNLKNLFVMLNYIKSFYYSVI